MFEFLLPALLAGFAITLIAGPLGCFVVWRKMAYFGDTLAHASLLGITFGLMWAIDLHIALVISSLLIALLLVLLQRQRLIATDTLLGILSHSALSIGMVTLAFFDNIRVDLMNYLFGDLLAVGYQDILWITAIALTALAILIVLWRPMLLTTINPDLAAVEGINTQRMQLCLMLLMGLVIAIAMQFVGALIITALLIIPAASARKLATSPEVMAIFAVIFGMIAVVGGLGLSWHYNTPAGPSVVVCASMLFVITQLIPKKQ
ncbi:High-affinity zinc uptake system membrane protein ZnuB [Vibrio stylophorae]|uniref:High-affinity zinc uptake system membrane protein ZnuB n=1 Tax=Vibrio stylophorae TaxID=659351 RepID=A0ABM8ZU76_9VIBR|nr:zinc ABC transporter permease subunit ZnuB [Vibrio stylophorae]CAH0533875.1 High-affinity zinc uptake system membrane protein ZnuB [Vibrio stylophorae]